MKARLLAIFFLTVLGGSLRATVMPGVSFEQRIGDFMPLAVRFTDTEGRQQELGRWLQKRPVVLWFGYARCPQLCSVVSEGMVSSLRQLGPTVGKDFDVFMVSIDPTETADLARASRNESLGHYGRTGAERGWYYLTGNAAAIKEAADGAGFHFLYDERTRQYAHPSGFLVLTPEGKISAYFPGVDFSPAAVAAAISRAGRNGLGQKVSELLLLCFRGDGISGRYGLVIWRTLGAAVALTVLVLAAGIGRMLWFERQALRRSEGERA